MSAPLAGRRSIYSKTSWRCKGNRVEIEMEMSIPPTLNKKAPHAEVCVASLCGVEPMSDFWIASVVLSQLSSRA